MPFKLYPPTGRSWQEAMSAARSQCPIKGDEGSPGCSATGQQPRVSSQMLGEAISPDVGGKLLRFRRAPEWKRPFRRSQGQSNIHIRETHSRFRTQNAALGSKTSEMNFR
jgi:hypothetical protein